MANLITVTFTLLFFFGSWTYFFRGMARSAPTVNSSELCWRACALNGFLTFLCTTALLAEVTHVAVAAFVKG